jgi:hypothetical protein
MLDWMVWYKVDGGVSLRGLVVNAMLESVVELVYCKVQVCNNIINLIGGAKM